MKRKSQKPVAKKAPAPKKPVEAKKPTTEKTK
jgi:hypothetical protein